jgi:hypothetical protein
LNQEKIMQSAEERRRLLRDMQDEPVRAWMVLARCAAGLAVIVLLAVVGVSESRDHGIAGNVAAGVTPPATGAAPERQERTVDERRTHSEKQDQRNSGKAKSADLPIDLPMEVL